MNIMRDISGPNIEFTWQLDTLLRKVVFDIIISIFGFLKKKLKIYHTANSFSMLKIREDQINS